MPLLLHFRPSPWKGLLAFPLKCRPQRWDGEPDAETAAILDALTSAPAAP